MCTCSNNNEKIMILHLEKKMTLILLPFINQKKTHIMSNLIFCVIFLLLVKDFIFLGELQQSFLVSENLRTLWYIFS